MTQAVIELKLKLLSWKDSCIELFVQNILFTCSCYRNF